MKIGVPIRFRVVRVIDSRLYSKLYDSRVRLDNEIKFKIDEIWESVIDTTPSLNNINCLR